MHTMVFIYVVVGALLVYTGVKACFCDDDENVPLRQPCSEPCGARLQNGAPEADVFAIDEGDYEDIEAEYEHLECSAQATCNGRQSGTGMCAMLLVMRPPVLGLVDPHVLHK